MSCSKVVVVSITTNLPINNNNNNNNNNKKKKSPNKENHVEFIKNISLNKCKREHKEALKQQCLRFKKDLQSLEILFESFERNKHEKQKTKTQTQQKSQLFIVTKLSLRDEIHRDLFSRIDIPIRERMKNRVVL